MNKPNIYADCAHIERPPVDKIISEELIKGYPVLPLYEKNYYEYIYTRYYSLTKNEYYKCRWKCYKDNLKNRVFTPFKFVNSKDFHVVNGQVDYRPWDTVGNRKDYRFKLKPGPGVDALGQMPIPDELQMKRGNKLTNKKSIQPVKEDKDKE